jgi:hypothetical protein
LIGFRVSIQPRLTEFSTAFTGMPPASQRLDAARPHGRRNGVAMMTAQMHEESG